GGHACRGTDGPLQVTRSSHPWQRGDSPATVWAGPPPPHLRYTLCRSARHLPRWHGGAVFAPLRRSVAPSLRRFRLRPQQLPSTFHDALPVQCGTRVDLVFLDVPVADDAVECLPLLVAQRPLEHPAILPLGVFQPDVGQCRVQGGG